MRLRYQMYGAAQKGANTKYRQNQINQTRGDGGLIPALT
jgi:hypothetical protein